jgi:hypothetical protein
MGLTKIPLNYKKEDLVKALSYIGDYFNKIDIQITLIALYIEQI